MMNWGAMTLQRFADRLAQYGVDFASWPAREGQAARKLVAASRQAAALLQREIRLLALFEADEMPEPPTVAAIVDYATANAQEQAAVQPRRVRRSSWFSPGWRYATAALSCLLIGTVAGMASVPRDQTPDHLYDMIDSNHLSSFDE